VSPIRAWLTIFAITVILLMSMGLAELLARAADWHPHPSRHPSPAYKSAGGGFL